MNAPEDGPGLRDPAAREVWRTVRALNDAWTRADGSRLPEYFHERMVAIVPGARERLAGRAACVASWRSFVASAAIHGWQEIDPRVEMYGDAAVVTYEYRVEITRDGSDLTLRGRDMLTLVRENGRWWLVADQFSPLPGGSPSV